MTNEINELTNILTRLKSGGKIHIKKENKGKFTDYCGGKVTSECIAKGKKSSDPKIRKRATFADNARKWKHQSGGTIITDPVDTSSVFYEKHYVLPSLKLFPQGEILTFTDPKTNANVFWERDNSGTRYIYNDKIGWPKFFSNTKPNKWIWYNDLWPKYQPLPEKDVDNIEKLFNAVRK